MAGAGEQLDGEWLEITLLLEGIFLKYGYDFRNYTGAHLRRRLAHRKEASHCQSYLEMLHRLIYEPEFFEIVLLDLSINVTEMYRDPIFYKSIRRHVVKHLLTYPFIRVWHAGCSAGQEVYSMCILLAEEGVRRKRLQIYATDFNDAILEKAKEAIYPMEVIRDYTSNYQKAGGLNSFSEYYTAGLDNVMLTPPLRDRILFSAHNLATDGVFAEMNIIFCRNVLIYFNKELQDKVLELFYKSLCPGGFLCLGSKENLKFTRFADKFEVVAARERIYRKKR